MDDEIGFLSATELASRISKRQIKVIEVVETSIARASKLQPVLHAFITLASEEARLEARRLDSEIQQGRSLGPLHGLPFACKDVFYIRGLPTTAGSRVMEGFVADEDATAIERAKAAGAVLLGTNNLHEFAFGATGDNKVYGTVPNPWKLSCIAGGSSTGSAAAVAAGIVPLALGTDTAGSVRLPASFCGIVGLKPTFGIVSTYGTIPFSWSLDHVGIFARRVEDVALGLAAITGYDPRDQSSVPYQAPDYQAALQRDIRGLRIGIPRRFFYEDLDPEVAEATEGVLSCAERLGAVLSDVEMPDIAESRTVSFLVQMPEALSYHSRHLRERSELYGEDVRKGLAIGQFILAEHYVRAKRMMRQYRDSMVPLFEDIDILLTPTTPMVSPPIGLTTIKTGTRTEALGNAYARFTSFFNLTGHPAISIPSGWHASGVPIGAQLIASPFDDHTLLGVGRALERALAIPERRALCES